MPKGLRWPDPLKITSSMRWLRKALARCSPQNPADGFDHIGFAAAIGTDYGGDARVKGISIFWAKDLKPNVRVGLGATSHSSSV